MKSFAFLTVIVFVGAVVYLGLSWRKDFDSPILNVPIVLLPDNESVTTPPRNTQSTQDESVESAYSEKRKSGEVLAAELLAEQKILEVMVEKYEGVKTDRESRNEHVEAMTDRLTKYNKTVLPVALEKIRESKRD